MRYHVESSSLRRRRVVPVVRRRSALLRRRVLPAGLKDVLRPSTTLAQLFQLVAEAGLLDVVVGRAAPLRRRRWTFVVSRSVSRQRLSRRTHQRRDGRRRCQEGPRQHQAYM